MADVKKKGNGRRIKRSVKKTLGALFLASAIVVAAIPTNNFSSTASSPEPPLKVTADDSKIPRVDTSKPYNIYTTADGAFQFAYLSTNDVDSTNRYAVLLGYAGGKLDQYGNLTIPDEVDAYLKYSYSQGSNYGYCAVGKSGNFLYYQTSEIAKDEYGNDIYDIVYEKNPDGSYKLDSEGAMIPIVERDENGDPLTDNYGQPIYKTELRYRLVYKPCYNTDIRNWNELNEEEFYYNVEEIPGYTPTSDERSNPSYPYFLTDNNHADYQRIKQATVRYIGNQFLVAGEGANAGTWTVSDQEMSPSTGIFNGDKAGNIVTLKVGENLMGIGNYAFYGCTSLQGIELNNGLQVIGNHAFAECINMKTVDIKLNATISTIGDHAFYNCDSLVSFTMPVAVQQIGDYAFARCDSLRTLNLCGGTITGEQGEVIELNHTNLRTLGNNVFLNCPKLERVEFPGNFAEENLPISMWNGCSSLECIKVNNTAVNFVDDTADGVDDFETFKNQVAGTFYFEGFKPSVLYNTATQHSIAFKYYDEDVYEITVLDGTNQNVYQVNSSNQLIDAQIASGSKNIILPETIGPYHITRIREGSFRNKCSIEKVVIPSTIEVIEQEAFMGCHNLGTVIFEEPVQLTEIGPNAFKTQAFTGGSHTSGCAGIGSEAKRLIFVGPISKDCVAFQYAMDRNSNINNGTQQYSYIIYQGGWPNHLEVQYNTTTGLNELVNYPTLVSLRDAKYTTADYPYMTPEYVTSAQNAAGKYIAYLENPLGGNNLTEFETEIIDATMNIHLPDGIEGVKDGLFLTNETADKSIVLGGGSSIDLRKTLTADGLLQVGANDFSGCDNFVAIALTGQTQSIGSHAFEGCRKLRTVSLPASLRVMGNRPFADCGTDLVEVQFSGSPYFLCENSIIYEMDPDTGKKTKIVECLEGKTSPMITADETEGILGIYPEAFMDTDVVSVDLGSSKVDTIPAYSFAETTSLTQLTLPDTVRGIEDNAFENSKLRILKIPGVSQSIGNNAFRGVDTSKLTFYCEPDSGAAYFAKLNNIAYSFQEPEISYKVSFYDREGNLLETVTVTEYGGAAKPPVAPTVEGYEFVGWMPDKYACVTENIPYVQAQYEKKDVVIVKHTVTFVDDDEAETVLYTQTVDDGADVVIPQSPSKEGYTFKGWKGNLKNIVRDEKIYAYYEKNAPDANSSTGNGNNSGSNTGSNGNSNSSGNNTGSSGNNNSTGGTAVLYVLTVQNGSGSGSYAAGSQPVIVANDPATGQEFSHWTIEPANTAIASTVLSASVITMPQANVTVKANYKEKASGNNTGNTGSNTNTNRPNNGTVTNNGTTVVIDKNGLSNTGVVNVTIGGSSDNFTLKITENSSATEEILRALMAEYGNDLSNIKYFPMDISLYDSTGTKRITDTTGLSINVTLPLPDSLRIYAGNNKVAGVVNQKLDKLTPKFTTIDNVPCVTFKAEHFSPYVIYVDTGLLSTGSSIDETPKTGDGIHPKWFLSIGLACASLVMFLQRDGRKKLLRR